MIAKLIPPQYRMLAVIAGVGILAIGSYAAGWAVNGWKWEAKYDKREANLAVAHAEAVEAARAEERASAAITVTVGDTHAEKEAEIKVVERVVTKKVIEYVQAPYAGKCDLPVSWVRLDTLSAVGTAAEAGKPAAQPHGGTGTASDAGQD